MVKIDMTQATVEMLADPNYRHPWLSMFPPTRGQIRDAAYLRMKRRQEDIAAAKQAAEQIAAEKAATEKAATEKVADEQAAAEKSAAEKAAADKAAADKAAADKAAAEQAAKEGAAALQAESQARAGQAHHSQQADDTCWYHICPAHLKADIAAIHEMLISGKSDDLTSDLMSDERNGKRKGQKTSAANKKGAEDGDSLAQGKPPKHLKQRKHSQKSASEDANDVREVKDSEDVSIATEVSDTLAASTEPNCDGPDNRATSNQQLQSDRHVRFGDQSLDHILDLEITDNDIPPEYLYRRPHGIRIPKILKLLYGPDGKMYDSDGNVVILQVHGKASDEVPVVLPEAAIGSNLVPSAADIKRTLHEVKPNPFEVAQYWSTPGEHFVDLPPPRRGFSMPLRLMDAQVAPWQQSFGGCNSASQLFHMQSPSNILTELDKVT